MRPTLLFAILAAVTSLFGAPVNADDSLDSETRETVRQEVRQVLEAYREAMLTRDFDTRIAFWSDSEDFVFAGDGRILGGFDAWKQETTRHYSETDHWEIWDWQNVNVLPLSVDAASATVEFRFRWVDTQGQTHNSRGAWTYVFRRESEGWKVVHTNGTHVGL